MSGPQRRTELAEILGRHGLIPRKALGQHFVVEPNLIRKLVSLVEAPPGSPVLEVGAGTGTLTRALGEAGFRVLAYEVDSRLLPILDEVVGGLGQVEVRGGDALAVDFAAVLGDGPWTMVSNLPYHVGTPLLLTLLRTVPAIERFVVMIQREVADRLGSPPGSRQYGIPSVVAQLHADVHLALRVPAHLFVPPPRVASAVVVLQRHPAPPGTARAIELAEAAFGQRRKMLRSALAGVVEGLPEVLARAGIQPEARAEQLSPADYLRLAEADHGG